MPNCDKCEGRNNCKSCKDDYIAEENKNLCSLIYDPRIECKINMHNIDDKDISFLQEENINKLVEEYIDNNLDKGEVNHYINNIYYYSITLFKMGECTKNLLPIDDYYLNTKNNIRLYNNGHFINCFISYNFKNYINIYKSNDGQKINMEINCPECLESDFYINNNFTNEILNYSLIIEKIKEENIDIFSKDNEALIDKCNSLDIGGVIMPLEIKDKIFYNNNNYESILCTDANCKINSKNMEELISDSNCKINYEFNYLLDNINNINNNQKGEEEEFVTTDSSLSPSDVFSCVFNNKDTKKLFTTFWFYFTISCAVIEIIAFILYVLFKQRINLEKYSN